MSETNTDSRKAAQREQGFYWVKYQGRWHVGLWGSPSIDNWIISGKFYQDDKFDEIDETQITRQSRPATLGEVSDEKIKEAADEFYNNASVWHVGYFTSFQAGVRWRESIIEKPDAKPTESEQVEKTYSLDDMKDSFRAGRALERTEGRSFQNPTNFQAFIDRLNSLKQ